MAKIKLNLGNLGVEQLRDLAQRIITAMTTNVALFTAPKPTLVQLTNFLNPLIAGIAAVETADQVAKQKRSELQAARKALEDGLTEEAGYVESVVKGDPAKIQMAGMDVRAAAAPVGPLAQVLNLAATEGDHDGTVDLQWDRVRGTRMYEVQTSPDGTSNWSANSSHSKSACTVTGLQSGAKLWFRVRAVGVAGPGPWSDPATKIVP